MTPFADLIAQGTAHAWVFIPSAILLGALHGLEPGHSKTMMAAFIVAIRGTIGQAVLLALAATVSHTAIVWILAGLALTFGDQWNAAATEPYFQLASGVVVIGI
ncbi:MAG TPA: nickel/cobalt efflux protein RcnA, partial [Gammaproteobacteria bacterium]|nr:nickel/cobalt efflux protein RcnA [Gammaproteobacteria bacterium]